MKDRQLIAAMREHAVQLGLGLALLVAVVVFWHPLVHWFTGEAMGGGGGGKSAPAPSQGAAGAADPSTPGGAPAPSEAGQHDAPIATAAPALRAHRLPDKALAAMQNAFTAYEEVRALLARDQVKGIAVPARLVSRQIRAAAAALGGGAPEMAATLSEAASAADKLAAATALDGARRWFGEVSRSLVAVAAADPRLQSGWHLFHCPMAKGYPKWFQRGKKLENPYMGQAMLTCGSSAKWEAAAAAAPGAAPTTLSHEGHGHAGDDVAYYTCAMHPSVKRKEPGTCPICSMNLSPVTYDELESGVVRVDESRRERIGLKTARVGRAPMSIAIRAVGRLTFDETRLKDVTLRVKGWITRLRVNATGQPVRRGEPLLSVYSPELYAAQQEYLLALDSHRAAGASGRSDYLVVAAEKKLRLWGMTSGQLAALARSGKAMEEVPIAAPASGYVIEKDVVEGAAVEPGQRLFRIAALDKVWVEAQIYELDLGQVRVGQKAIVTLPYQPGDSLEGTVAYIYPYLDPSSRTGRVRIELRNDDLAFKPDMYANVEIRVDLGPRLLIPTDAVVYTGPRRLVFVDLGEGRFRPQEVTLGARSGEAVEVLAGLRAGDVIVTSGNFLIAAESRIRSASELWSDEVSGDPAAPTAAPPATTAAPPATTAAPPAPGVPSAAPTAPPTPPPGASPASPAPRAPPAPSTPKAAPRPDRAPGTDHAGH